MPEPLSKRLAPLENDQWYPLDAATEDQVAAAEAAVKRTFPADYRDVLLAGGGEITGENARILLFPPGDLSRFNPDPDWKELHEMFVFADDSGDFLYFYDPDNKLKRGAWSIFVVAKGSPFLRHALYAAKDLGHLVDRIFAGDEVLDVEPS